MLQQFFQIWRAEFFFLKGKTVLKFHFFFFLPMVVKFVWSRELLSLSSF